MSNSITRLLAFYLPQFHPIPENDVWWGKGFTEWTNVLKAKPLFPGHYQPRIPADLGFYDLRVSETRAAQAEMALEHGIQGFCYWHYWFAGKRLLESLFQEVLESREPNFPFCLAWANESWSGVWHGAPGRVLQEQTYPGVDDYKAHFYTLLGAFSDDRYITVNGKPMFIVYRPNSLPDAIFFTDYWRELAHISGLKGLYFVGVTANEAWVPAEHGFDAVTISNHAKIIKVLPKNPLRKFYRKLLRRQKVSAFYKMVLKRPTHIYPYSEANQYFIVENRKDSGYHPCVVPNWDNTPRMGLNGLVLHDSTPELFRLQVRKAVKLVAPRPANERIIFVKSWNEWAEGNHLEPDQRFGRQYLQVIREEVLGNWADI
jgi:hypothetical protein